MRITDFAPRHRQFGRVFRPPQLIRMIEPVAGLPRITIRFRPTHDYGHPFAHHSIGSNHIRFLHEGSVIRLTSDAPLSYIEREAPFVLTRPLHMVFGVDEPFQGDLETTCREFCDRTIDYWMDWSRGLSISYDWQDEIIRAAITLKLSNFEETGGIIAAHTTSIPEAAGLRAHLGLPLLLVARRLFRREGAQPHRCNSDDGRFHFLHAEHRIQSQRADATRSIASFRSMRWTNELRPSSRVIVATVRCASAMPPPCRCRMILMAASSLPRCRCFSTGDCLGSGDEGLFRLLESLGARAGELALEADNGIWEYRGRRRIHTHSTAMCWAGCHRLAAIAARLGLAGPGSPLERGCRARSPGALLQGAWNEKRQAFTAAFGSDDLDASVLLLPDLGVIEAEDPRFISTVKAMERELLREKHVMRYAAADDFGLPATAFLICRFWLVDAWWSLGRREEARELFVDALAYRNRYGLLSEDIDPQTGTLWGNFPQTYSMAGLILTAMRLSRSWEDRYWRG